MNLKLKQSYEIERGKIEANSPRLLTLKKAAVHIGLTEWGMRERIWAGEIPVIRFPGGRKMWIYINDIEAFIEKNKEIIT